MNNTVKKITLKKDCPNWELKTSNKFINDKLKNGLETMLNFPADKEAAYPELSRGYICGALLDADRYINKKEKQILRLENDLKAAQQKAKGLELNLNHAYNKIDTYRNTSALSLFFKRLSQKIGYKFSCKIDKVSRRGL